MIIWNVFIWLISLLYSTTYDKIHKKIMDGPKGQNNLYKLPFLIALQTDGRTEKVN